MKPNTLRLVSGLALVAMFVIGYVFWSKVYLPGRQEESIASLSGTRRATLQTPPAPGEVPVVEPSQQPAAKPAASATSDYEKALNEYRSKGAYFQFVNCAGNPGTLTLKRGTVFMLDNRDNEPHKIKIGTVTYNLPAYGYKLVNPQKLGVNQITCDGGGAAAVNVQR